MAVKDGLPATDFSRMNREYIKAVAEGGSGGGLHAYEILLNNNVSDESARCETVATAAEIVSAAFDQNRTCICPDMGGSYLVYVGESVDEQLNEYYSLNIYSFNAPEQGATSLSLTYSYAEVLKANIETEKFVFKWDDELYWNIGMTPAT